MEKTEVPRQRLRERWERYTLPIIIFLIAIIVIQYYIFFKNNPQQFDKALIFLACNAVGGVMLYFYLTRKEPDRLLKVGEEKIIPAMLQYFGITASMQNLFFKEIEPSIYAYQYANPGKGIATIWWNDSKQEIAGHEMKRLDDITRQIESSEITKELIKERKLKEREKEELAKRGFEMEGEE